MDVELWKALGVDVDRLSRPIHVHLEALIHIYVESFCSWVREEDLVVLFGHNDDSFFEVAEDLIVADSHDFWLHEDHAHLGIDQVDEEEVNGLKYADEDDMPDHVSGDLFVVKKVSGWQLREEDDRDARNSLVEVEVVRHEYLQQIELEIVADRHWWATILRNPNLCH